MMWLNRLRRHYAPPPTPYLPSVPADDTNASRVRRELVRTALRDVLKAHRVPSGLLDCEVYFPNPEEAPGPMHIHLVIHRWSGKLLRYAVAIQRQLTHRVAHYDHGPDSAKLVIVWRFAETCACPYPDMPDPSIWQAARFGANPDPVRVLDRRRNAIRRPDGGVYLHAGGSSVNAAHDFAPTLLIG